MISDAAEARRDPLASNYDRNDNATHSFPPPTPGTSAPPGTISLAFFPPPTILMIPMRRSITPLTFKLTPNHPKTGTKKVGLRESLLRHHRCYPQNADPGSICTQMNVVLAWILCAFTLFTARFVISFCQNLSRAECAAPLPFR